MKYTDLSKRALPAFCVCAVLSGCGVEPSTKADDAALVSSPIVFGTDGRTEYLAITEPPLQIGARATAALSTSNVVVCSGATCSLTAVSPWTTAPTASGELPLCTDVRFRNQGRMPHCSAILVGTQTFMTAAHCLVGTVATQPSCTPNGPALPIVAYFGFNADASGTAATTIPSSDAYTCTSVQGSYIEGSEDWAVFTVDRPVTGRVPLIVDYTGLGTPLGGAVGVVGYPNGLPLKAAAGGAVKINDPSDLKYFHSSTDAFHGNSGGPVIDMVTGVAVGVTNSGPVYDFSDSVVSSQHCAETIVCSDTTGCNGGWSTQLRTSHAAKQGNVPLHPALVSTLAT